MFILVDLEHFYLAVHLWSFLNGASKLNTCCSFKLNKQLSVLDGTTSASWSWTKRRVWKEPQGEIAILVSLSSGLQCTVSLSSGLQVTVSLSSSLQGTVSLSSGLQGTCPVSCLLLVFVCLQCSQVSWPITFTYTCLDKKNIYIKMCGWVFQLYAWQLQKIVEWERVKQLGGTTLLHSVNPDPTCS